MGIKPEFETFAKEIQAELKKLVCDLTVIPAPSGHEERRAEFIKNWMEQKGAKGVFIDDALNVIWPYNDDGKSDLVVFMGHTDTVFPAETELKIREEGDVLYCPGIGDDTAQLCVMLTTAAYFAKQNAKPKTGMLFVANSCEEGLGNLKGTRQLMKTYGDRVKQVISYDSSLGHIVERPVGSHRYKVNIKTEGGHSYVAFGNRNAIHIMSSLIDSLYSVKVPKNGDSKTTYNVGHISGGTSVNTIAEECEMFYEYRSDDKECLALMKDMFLKMIEAYKATGVSVNVESLGERPCMGDVDPEAHKALLQSVADSFEKIGVKTLFKSASTDANIPLSLGIPAVTIGVTIAPGAHTLGEKLYVSSMLDGMRFSLDFMAKYFENQ